MPWTAIHGCVLTGCVKRLGMGIVPSRGLPEGWFAMLHTRGPDQFNQLGGITWLDPVGVRPVRQVTGLPPEMTAAGTPQLTGIGVGASALAPVNASGTEFYVGTSTNPALGGSTRTTGSIASA